MKITRISYSEQPDNANRWSLKDMQLQDINLIVGKNATGKTRLIHIIHNLALCIRGSKRITSSAWSVEFAANGTSLLYDLELDRNGLVETEKVVQDGQEKLVRDKHHAKIRSESKHDLVPIDPPADKLVLQVRRDKTEYPFLELLADWATHSWRFAFAELNSTNLVGKVRQASAAASNDDMLKELDSLGMAPYVLDELPAGSVERIIREMNDIGFSAQTIKSDDFQNVVPLAVKHIQFGEADLKLPIPQTQLSTGLLRALALLIVLEYLLIKKSKQDITILIDDLDEGLDYERANNLSRLIFEKVKGTHVQLIAATNSRAMMNGVDIEYWNILERTGGVVKTINYHNSKEAFDKFKFTGLSNFDLFASDYLTKS